MIEFRIQEKTRSLNESFRGDWRPRAAVAKRQRTKAMQACPKWPGGPLLAVRLTRVSPGVLDHANLAGALKHVQDGVASRLKVDDASPLVQWIFEQVVGDAEAVVQIWRDGEDSPPLPVGRPVERKRLAPGTGESGGTKRGRATREKRQRCNKNGCRRLLPCAEHSHHLPRPACDAPTETLAFARALNAQPNYNAPPIPRANRTNPMATKAVVPSNADEHRALLAAMEAEATFAPAPVCIACGGTLQSCTCGARP